MFKQQIYNTRKKINKAKKDEEQVGTKTQNNKLKSFIKAESDNDKEAKLVQDINIVANFLCKEYKISIITSQIAKTVRAILLGELKDSKGVIKTTCPISAEDLIEMFTIYKAELQRINAYKECKNQFSGIDSKIIYNLHIVISKYDEFVKYKQEEAENLRRINSDNSESDTVFSAVYSAQKANNKKVSEEDLSDLFNDIENI